MADYANDDLTRAEKGGFGKLCGQRYVDIHCHCLPAVDDGPATETDALALCNALLDDGIEAVIATPHQLGRFSDCNEPARIRERVSILNGHLRNADIPLTILPGADVRVDERICDLLAADKILTLADGRKYILLELPSEIFIDIEPLLVQLGCLGIRAIISHPERHPAIAKQLRVLQNWFNHSTLLQVTSGSLLGKFGMQAEETAWQFLAAGWVSLVATDSHDLVGRRPCMRDAFRRISSKLGQNLACEVCIENPSRVLKGQDVRPVHFAAAMEYAR
jgi:protein-tyrosine phosphatase